MAATSIVIFGASGDLTRRKLIPALFNLYRKERLPPDFRVVGFALSEWDDTGFRQAMRAGAAEFAEQAFEPQDWERFAGRLFYQTGGFTEPSDYEALAARLSELEKGATHRLFYLATPPRFYAEIAGRLDSAGLLAEEEGWRRVIVEKPFGRDLASARSLNQDLHRVLDESQIYRIDHYLGKETVQNVLVFRFANAIYEPVWNRNFIDHVQITAAETVDVGHRAGYYEQAGVLKDMFQNHMLQLLALVAMEPPASFDADAIRNEKVKLVGAIRPIRAGDVAAQTLRGQYEGYREAEGVAPDSNTPTFAAVRLFIDNWRWQGVPFYLRSGKALPEKVTQIAIQFKQPPHVMFPQPEGFHLTPNLLSICVQPDEGIHLRFEAKVPDTPADMRSVNMNFHYEEAFGAGAIPEAYERLLLDALNGDASLFARADGIENAWRFVDPILQHWQEQNEPPLLRYAKGSWGPVEEAFLLGGGRAWVVDCGKH